MKRVFTKLVCAALASVMTISCAPVADFGFMPALAVETAAATITAQADGWHETAYVEWLPVTGATAYDVYVKSSGGSYTQLDSELVRQYNTFWRADALGLAKGTYNMKVVAKNSSGAEVATWESASVTVDSYIRDGFAFSDGGSSSGAYNDDGTLKSDAVIFYITDDNKDTITFDVVTGSSDTKTTCTGMGPIIKALEKGYETRPMVFRFIGQVNDPVSEQSLNQIDIKRAVNPITIEGVGNDAFAHFGFNLVEANNLEVRNMGFKNMTTVDEDGVTIKSASQRIWVHNCDFFYGGAGSDKDQAKGDGSVDLKEASTKITVSDNHYWDSGKVNLCGLKETADYEITYARNWFDHSDSRHPRVRTGSVHVYNNYYDGVAKYGVGACTGSSIFVESNYFRNTSKPVMSSMQGTDAAGSGTFSSEDGGIIKMYDNIMVGIYTFIEANDNGTLVQNSDGYTVSNRTDTVPSSLTTVQGGTSYNNFDTLRDLGVTASGVLAAKDVPAYVTANAGRINGGNFKFTFDDSVDDSDYNVNTALDSALDAYTYQADTDNVSSKSATGIDGSSFYQDRQNTYTAKVSTLATETDPSGNKATGGGGTVTSDLTALDAGTYTAATIVSDTERFTVSSNKAQTAGQLKIDSGYVAFKVNDGATVTVNYKCGSSSGSKTAAVILNGQTAPSIAAGGAAQDFTVSGLSAGTYLITATQTGSSSAQISSITVAYGSTSVTEGISETTTASAEDTTKEASTETTTSAPVVVPTGGVSHNFTENGTSSTFYTITGNLSTAKGTVTYNGLTLTQCLKMESSTSITFNSASAGTLTLVLGGDTAASGKTVKIDGTGYTADSNGIVTVDVESGAHTITKGDSINLYYMNFTSDSADTTESTTETTTLTTIESTTKATTTESTTKATTTESTTESTTQAPVSDKVQVNHNNGSYSFTTANKGTLTTDSSYGGAYANLASSDNNVVISADGAVLTDTSVKSADGSFAGYSTDLTMPLGTTYTSGILTIEGKVTPSVSASKWAYIDIQGDNGSVLKIGTDDSKKNAISSSVDSSNNNVYVSSTTTSTASAISYKAVLDLTNKTATVTMGSNTLTTALVNTSVSKIVSTTSKGSARNITVGDITVTYEAGSVTPSVIRGDANDDGVVDKNDVMHILQYVVHKISAVNNPEAADVTDDGKVTSRDANKIMKAILNGTTADL